MGAVHDTVVAVSFNTYDALSNSEVLFSFGASHFSQYGALTQGSSQDCVGALLHAAPPEALVGQKSRRRRALIPSLDSELWGLTWILLGPRTKSTTKSTFKQWLETH